MPEYSGQLTQIELAALPLWLIPLFPFIGAAINAIFGRDLQASPWQKDFSKKQHIGSAAVTAVAVGAMLLAFTVTLINAVKLVGLPADSRYLYTYAWQMLRIGSLEVNFSFAMDPLSSMMTLIVTGVGTMIHIYAASYMEKEPAYWRFFAYLNLFIFSMLLLVLGDNMVVLFFGWEGVGLCSYLLIGFWYKDYKKATAGMKAFVVNRVGDWGFICGMALLFWGLGGAWLSSTGEYLPDYNARFIASRIEALPHGHHGAGHGDDHGAAHGKADHGKADHGTAGHGKADGHGHGNGLGYGDEPMRLAQAGHDHKGHDHKHDHGHAPRRPKRPPVNTSIEQLKGRANTTGTLTMVTHPGSRVYFGVATVEDLKDKQKGGRRTYEACSSRPSWNAADGPQLTNCYAESPFLRKRITAGTHAIMIVPGGGAVPGRAMAMGAPPTDIDRGDVGPLRVQIKPGKESMIIPIGPTLTFRELHDQLQVKNGRGQQFIKDALKSKTVWGGIGLITLACLCMFIGATGKSAQLPLYVWLPDAMAGPTPVSALIHAATMVTAGVYMIARMNFLFSLTPTASGVIALVGACTALFAASIGFFQYDIKKVLAYSTVSQLGFMFIGVGVGAYWAGVFHLMTHAFFKACLFLGSGSVIHGMHHVVHDDDGAQDMRNMGGLKRVMPITAKTYFIACFAITAAPIPTLAGFWSKDEILWKAFNTAQTGAIPGFLIYLIGLVAAIGTSFYMWRSYFLTFEGPHALREIEKGVHESPKAMTYVLIALAFLAAVSGWIFGASSHHIGGHGEPLLEQWLHPVMAHSEAKINDAGLAVEWMLIGVSVFAAIGAWGVAKVRYGASRPANWDKIEQGLPGFRTLYNKYWVDEIYDATVVAAFMKLRLFLAETDRWIVDGIVNGAGVAAKGAAWVTSAIDKYLVDGAVNFVAQITSTAGDKLRALQTGRVQNYIYGILGGVAFLAVVQYFLG